MIPIAKPIIENDEVDAVARIMKSGILAQGEEVKKFEEEFARYIGVRHAVAVCNGTAALDIILKSIGVKGGHEVIVPDFTFIASANAVLYQGAKVVFCDVKEDTFNIDVDDVKKKISKKTKAIMAVHLFGQPADLAELREICEQQDIILIEDACQAHGAEYDGKKVGGFGIGAFSFYPTKNMTTGEGGMITTNDDEIAEFARMYRDQGQKNKYEHSILGHNMRMTNIAAAFGRVQLKKLDRWNEKRIKNAEKLTRGLAEVAGITPPYTKKNVKHVFHQYVIKVEREFPRDRDGLKEFLAENGVGTGIHYPKPIHMQPLYQKLGYNKNLCQVSTLLSNKVLSLPVHPEVSEDDISFIIELIHKASERSG
ncbi:MAG: DegT/DnrJ/EryC1/StrS family aminotransferase [Candidatus Anstonellales archaeon]